jgi:replication factor A1
MIQMPYQDIIAKIKEAKGLSDAELDVKVKKKMDALSGLISKEGAAYIVANELGVKLIPTSGCLQIKQVMIGMRTVETMGKVMRKFPINEFERNGKSGKVGSFIIADETGQIRITAWHEMTDHLSKFNEGDILKIVGGYVRENNGAKEIHLNSTSKLIVNPEGAKVNVASTSYSQSGGFSQAKAVRKKISELKENDDNIEILGHIVQVFDPRFYPVCPNCNKRAEQVGEGYRCAEHGLVTPDYSFVMNAFVDDGSDNIRAVFFKKQAINLLETTEENMREYRGSPEKFEKVKNDILGEQAKIIGRVSRNEVFDRLEIVARLVFRDIDPEKEIAVLKQQKSDIAEIPKTSSAVQSTSASSFGRPQMPSPRPEKMPAPPKAAYAAVEEEDVFDDSEDDSPRKRMPSVDDI